MKIFLWLACAILMGAYICIPLTDPDLWWHLTVGRWILAHGDVPRVDYWNMFEVGHPWRSYSWSYQLVYALVERWQGLKGLAVLQMGLAVALAATFQYALGRTARNHFVGALLGVYATAACFAHFSLRPQTLVWILFVAVLAVVDDAASKSLSKRRLAALAVLGCLWANTHLTAVLGLVAILLWLLPSRMSFSDVRVPLVAAAAFFVGTLATPYMGGEWLTFFSKSGHPLQFSSIDEFKPAHILQYSTGFVILQLGLLVTLCGISGRYPSPGRCILCGGMLLAGLTAVKFLPFATIALATTTALWWRDFHGATSEGHRNNLVRGVREGQQRFDQLHPQTIGATAFFILSLAIVHINHKVRGPLLGPLVPKDAVDYIEARQLSHPLLNDFGTGGYLMYRFSDSEGTPLHTVPIDGRTNVNDPDVFQSYHKAFFAKEGWDKYFTTVKPKTVLWSNQSPLVSVLLVSPEWCRVFKTSGELDAGFSVFITRAEFDQRHTEFTASDC